MLNLQKRDFWIDVGEDNALLRTARVPVHTKVPKHMLWVDESLRGLSEATRFMLRSDFELHFLLFLYSQPRGIHWMLK